MFNIAMFGEAKSAQYVSMQGWKKLCVSVDFILFLFFELFISMSHRKWES